MNRRKASLVRTGAAVAGGAIGAKIGSAVNKSLAYIASNPNYVKTGEHKLGAGNINAGQWVDTITNTHAHLEHLMQQGYDAPMKVMGGLLGGAVAYTMAKNSTRKEAQQPSRQRTAHFAEGVNNSRNQDRI